MQDDTIQIGTKNQEKSLDFNEIQNPYVRAYLGAPIHRMAPKIGRNDICTLENKKFKNCCGKDGYNFCKKLLVNYLQEAYNQKNA